jgi:hypothetical protein
VESNPRPATLASLRRNGVRSMLPAHSPVKVTFVSTRPGILHSRRILNHAKPSITAGRRHEKYIVEYRLFAFEYKYYIVSITFLIHYKNINLFWLQNAFQQPL